MRCHKSNNFHVIFHLLKYYQNQKPSNYIIEIIANANFNKNYFKLVVFFFILLVHLMLFWFNIWHTCCYTFIAILVYTIYITDIIAHIWSLNYQEYFLNTFIIFSNMFYYFIFDLTYMLYYWICIHNHMESVKHFNIYFSFFFGTRNFENKTLQIPLHLFKIILNG